MKRPLNHPPEPPYTPFTRFRSDEKLQFSSTNQLPKVSPQAGHFSSDVAPLNKLNRYASTDSEVGLDHQYENRGETKNSILDERIKSNNALRLRHLNPSFSKLIDNFCTEIDAFLDHTGTNLNKIITSDGTEQSKHSDELPELNFSLFSNELATGNPEILFQNHHQPASHQVHHLPASHQVHHQPASHQVHHQPASHQVHHQPASHQVHHLLTSHQVHYSSQSYCGEEPDRCLRKRSDRDRHVRKRVKRSIASSSEKLRYLSIHKLIYTYRRLELRCKLLETVSAGTKHPEFDHCNAARSNSNVLEKLKRFMRICYELLKQQIVPITNNVTSRYHDDQCDVKFNMEGIPIKVEKTKSRNRQKCTSHSPNTLHEDILSGKGESVRPAALTVKYDGDVKSVSDSNICKRIFQETPPECLADEMKLPSDNLLSQFANNSAEQLFSERVSSKNKPANASAPDIKPSCEPTTNESPTSIRKQQTFVSSESRICSASTFRKTYKISVCSERLSGKVWVGDHYVTTASWINNGKLYVGRRADS